MGKSALVESFLRDAAAAGALVLTGRCRPHEVVPYKALDGLVDSIATALTDMGVVGLRPAPDDDDVLTLGLGLGYHADVASDLGVEVDVLAHYVTFGYDIADRDAWWGQTRLKAVYAATDFVHLLAGLSLNVAVSSDDPEGLLTKGPDAMIWIVCFQCVTASPCWGRSGLHSPERSRT